jgi:hypothetical protein
MAESCIKKEIDFSPNLLLSMDNEKMFLHRQTLDF